MARMAPPSRVHTGRVRRSGSGSGLRAASDRFDRQPHGSDDPGDDPDRSEEGEHQPDAAVEGGW